MTGAPRGVKNCNPCNIKTSAEEFVGEITSTDTSFKQFQDMVHGVRAASKILLTYFDKHKIKTIAGIIQRWAPKDGPDDNDVVAYVDDVAKFMGVLVLEQLDLHNPGTLSLLVKAIIKHENGWKDKDTKEMWVDDIDVMRGVRLALGIDK